MKIIRIHIYICCLFINLATWAYCENNQRQVELYDGNFVKLNEIHYEFGKPSSLMGDGYYAIIATVNSNSLHDYINKNAMATNGWKCGSVQKQDEQLVQFLKRWARVHKVYHDIANTKNVWNLLDSKDIMFWEKKKLKESGRISNGLLYVIIPSQSLLVILQEDT